MASGGGGQRERQSGAAGLLLVACARLYGALLLLYPKAFRQRYASEMLRDFKDLSREGLGEGGATGLARVWVAALLDLALSALLERSTMLARNAYLPVSPRIVARWGGLCALVGGLLGMTLGMGYLVMSLYGWDGVTVRSTAWFFELTIPNAAELLCVLGLFGLYGTLVVRWGRPGWLAGAGAALAVPSTLAALAAPSALALDLYYRYDWWWGQDVVLVYAHANFIAEVACLVGLLLLGVSAFRRRLWGGPLRVLPFVVVALWPALVVLNVLLVRMLTPQDLTTGVVFILLLILHYLPYLGWALLGWGLLKTHSTPS